MSVTVQTVGLSMLPFRKTQFCPKESALPLQRWQLVSVVVMLDEIMKKIYLTVLKIVGSPWKIMWDELNTSDKNKF